jgi:A/G-specific adenine glycosylase
MLVNETILYRRISVLILCSDRADCYSGEPPMKQIEVAIGIVLCRGQILICQRRPLDPLGGLWEFPGGKQEPGESLEQCLLRELAEELCIGVSVLEALPSIDYDYSAAHVRLHPYLCEHLEGHATPLAAQRAIWVKPSDLPSYSFPPANDNLIRELVRRFSQRS